MEVQSLTFEGIRGKLDDLVMKSDSKVIDNIKDLLTNISKEQAEAKATLVFLGSVQYPMMTQRETRIEDAHKKTFDWIFSHYRFSDWLRYCNGMFWIAGKAGCGKSTLMKYLCNHNTTYRILSTWAQDSRLVTATHFFWISGTGLQKSQEGLLRSLLSSIFTTCPELIPLVLPARWNAALAGKSDPWRRGDLLQALEAMKIPKLSARFCFFVDGLDEYEGDHKEIIEVLKSLADSPDIKICVSCRPWPVFEAHVSADDNLSSAPMLMLQDHTREDIRLFIKETLEDDLRFMDFSDDEHLPWRNHVDYTKENLIADIVDRAQGVFLWVALVCRDLLRGLQNEDTIAILRVRLNLLPATLEGYFSAILNRVDKVYQRQTSQILKLIAAAKEPLLLITFLFLEESDSDFPFRAELRPLTFEGSNDVCRKLRRQIKSRGGDLLEIEHDFGASPTNKQTVVFFHRTVRDFLLTKNIEQLLDERLHGPFGVDSYLSRAFVSLLKLLPEVADGCDITLRLFYEFFFYMNRIEKYDGKTDVSLIEETARVVQDRWFGRWRTEKWYWFLEDWIFVEAMHNGLHLYIAEKIRLDSRIFGIATASLHYVPAQSSKAILGKTIENKSDLTRKTAEQLHPPDSEKSGPSAFITSLWAEFLRSLSAQHYPDAYRESLANVVEVFLAKGADPWAEIKLQNGTLQPFGTIKNSVGTTEYRRLALIACS
jgi:hypothetical protein